MVSFHWSLLLENVPLKSELSRVLALEAEADPMLSEKNKPGAVACICNPSAVEAEMGRSLEFSDKTAEAAK